MKKKNIFLLLPLLIALALVMTSVCVAQPTPAPPLPWVQPGYRQVPPWYEQPGYYSAQQPPGFQQVPPWYEQPGYYPAQQPSGYQQVSQQGEQPGYYPPPVSMNCSNLRNCVDSCRQIQNCSAYLNCIDNCLTNAASAFEETAGVVVASNNTTNTANLKKKTKMAKAWAVPLTFS
jgi:hypothetical protein